ncbi:GTPase ObgE [Candidatus Kaiserbacteria bacterium]|nr:GTPase ObgE [Candidatus Kaiserbacteria bacterium]
MFVDELIIHGIAGKGGDGVVRWLRMPHRPMGGPAGGDGGNGGDVYIRAVRDLGLLSRYTGDNVFRAGNGENGHGKSQEGKNGEDMYIDLPVGSTVTDKKGGHVYVLEEAGQVHKILLGGRGGYGNEHFKSATNQSPEQSTRGKKGEEGEFLVELSLLVDVGFIGFPNAGKSTLLNTFTNATAAVGAYPFTTLEPHLGELFGFILADIPGLIEGASEGKGLGHKFLRHVRRTKMLLHLISLENEDVVDAYTKIQNELRNFDIDLLEKEQWVVLTKSDLVSEEEVSSSRTTLENIVSTKVFVISAETGEGVKFLQDELTTHLRKTSKKVG